MEGYVAYDDTSTAKRPGVVVIHDWMGLAPITEQRANELAAQQGTWPLPPTFTAKACARRTARERGRSPENSKVIASSCASACARHTMR